MNESHTPMTYRDAGVDIDRGNDLIDRIRPISARTRRPGVMGSVGGFGGLFEVPASYREPVLVSGTDGVGTKLLLAINLDCYDGVGIDLVAMCVNDVVTVGAEPLFFLDYYATGRLDETVATAVIAGIGRGCELAGAALIGGETAEMPGMYAPGDIDLAGFCVGIVEKSAIIDTQACAPGDVLIGLASSGAHANGYSLIRRVLEHSRADLRQPLDGRELGESLLEPTRIYVRAVRAVLSRLPVKAIAHITGGGLPENLPRVLPAGMLARLDTSAWTEPAVFDWLRDAGHIERDEMYRTFNCGLGLVMVIAAEHADPCLATLAETGEHAWVIGELAAGDGAAAVELS